MLRAFKTFLVSAVAGSMLVSAAAAFAKDIAPIPPEALGGGQAPKARLVALVAPGGSVVRSKGVAAVSHPFVGIYCILPTAGLGINVNAIVPAVSVDFDTSEIFAAEAQYGSGGSSGCPAGRISVITIDPVTNSLSNAIGFAIVVD